MEFAGKFESSNVSRDNISREIGRSGDDVVRQSYVDAVATP